MCWHGAHKVPGSRYSAINQESAGRGNRESRSEQSVGSLELWCPQPTTAEVLWPVPTASWCPRPTERHRQQCSQEVLASQRLISGKLGPAFPPSCSISQLTAAMETGHLLSAAVYLESSFRTPWWSQAHLLPWLPRV